jgi:hypothetical protein
VSLSGREPSHSVDGVASLSQLNASSTLKARAAKLHHAATDADREDNHAPGSDLQRNSILTPQLRLDNPISSIPVHAPAPTAQTEEAEDTATEVHIQSLAAMRQSVSRRMLRNR